MRSPTVSARAGWTDARSTLFDAGFARYWERSARSLAAPPAGRRRAAATWRSYAIRSRVRPYVAAAQHEHVDPLRIGRRSRRLASGARSPTCSRTATGWRRRARSRSPPCGARRGGSSAPTTSAPRSRRRPRAAAAGCVACRALADALPWLRQLHHKTLRPPLVVSPHRVDPGNRAARAARARGASRRGWGALEGGRAARRSGRYRRAWTRRDRRGGDALRLAGRAAPRLVVTGGAARPCGIRTRPTRRRARRASCAGADAVAIAAVRADLAVIDRHTRAFLAAVVDRDALPAPQPNTVQTGYTYLHRERRLIAYNLRRAGHGAPRRPAPAVRARTCSARARRTSGRISPTPPGGCRAASSRDAEPRSCAPRFARGARRRHRRAPAGVRDATAADLAALGAGGSPGDRARARSWSHACPTTARISSPGRS